MRLSRYLLPIQRDDPKDARAASHRLMLRAGLINELAPGLHAWLPLGLRVLDRVCAILREEMQRAGAIEIALPALHPAALWRESGRKDAFGPDLFRLRDRDGRDLVLGASAEEVAASAVRAGLRDENDLPRLVFQIGKAFRDEEKPRAGVLHAREFLMKDGYSFDRDPAGARHAYNRMFVAYLRSFAAMGLKAIPVLAGTEPIGGALSHEFVVLTKAGQSELRFDRASLDIEVPPPSVDYDDVAGLQGTVDAWTSHYAASDDMHDEAVFAEVPAEARVASRGIEIGHVFYLGTHYSELSAGQPAALPFHMGAYGIGVSRLVAAIVETHHDAFGIVWPDSVAPFDVILIGSGRADAVLDEACGRLETELQAAGLSVLHDDRSEPLQVKIASADLLGLPWQVIVGPEAVSDGRITLRRRATGQSETVAIIDLPARLRRL